MGHHHGSDMPTSARAVLHHTDQKGPNILTGSVFTFSIIIISDLVLFMKITSLTFLKIVVLT